MNAFALHLPQRRGLFRWTFAGAMILAAHAAIVASVALWYARRPVEPKILPAITVTLAPVEASAPEIQNQDVAVGPTMQQADAAPKEERKVEEKPVEQVEQPPPQPQAEVTLPRKEEKVDKPEPQPMAPAPETSAPRNSQVGQFTEAGSNAYDALVIGRLHRFLRYPKAGGGATGKVGLLFVLNRDGGVVSTEVTKSSGNRVLDREALDIVRRAGPFPPFPAAKPGEQEYYAWTVDFGH
jgi:periplasmic protein TonB